MATLHAKQRRFLLAWLAEGGDPRQKGFRVPVAIDTERNDTERPVHTSPCERDADRKSLNNSRRMNKAREILMRCLGFSQGNILSRKSKEEQTRQNKNCI